MLWHVNSWYKLNGFITTQPNRSTIKICFMKVLLKAASCPQLEMTPFVPKIRKMFTSNLPKENNCDFFSICLSGVEAKILMIA